MDNMSNFFNPLGEVPEEIKAAAISREVDRTSFFFELRRFLLGADPHTLWLLEGVFGTIASAGEDAAIRSSFYQGLTDALMSKSPVCNTCGVDHFKKDTLDRLAGAVPTQIRNEVIAAVTRREANRDRASNLEAAITESSRMDLMLDYRLKPRTDDPQTGNSRDGLECRDCGYPWPTLEDRMANGAPDACVGCFQKAAHG